MCPFTFALKFAVFVLLASIQCHGQNQPNGRHFALNLTALDALWHRAAIMALLKLKAESLLASLPPQERPVFVHCSQQGAATAVGLAKCVSALIRQRDRLEGRRRRAEETIGGEVQQVPASTLEGLLATLGQAMENLMGQKVADLNGNNQLNAIAAAVTTQQQQKPQQLMVPLEAASLRFERHPFWQRRQRDALATAQRLVHVQNLRELQRFWEIREFCANYLAENARRNAGLLGSHLPFPIRLRVDKPDSVKEEDIGQMLAKLMSQKQRRISLFSPRLFSLLPSSRKSFDGQQNDGWFLSPRLFSLAQNDGFFPLANLGGRDGRLLNRFLAITGAGRAIRQALNAVAEEKRQLEADVFPAVLELQKRDRKWAEMLDERQHRELAEWGFAFLRREQAELLYGQQKADDLFKPAFSAANGEQRQHRLERAIHSLAQIDEKPACEEQRLEALKVQNETTAATDSMQLMEADNSEDGPKILAPFAFTNFVADGVALEAMILSPHAFVSELLAPAALAAEVLSPRAFVAAILSPNALFSRVLSPGAFRAEVLSPRALTPFVLSPEAMIAEVLSPRALEPRVLSPEAGVIKVLSPVFLSPRVLSPEQLAVFVLSPTILSPGVLSPEALIVEVVSPHILSGGSEEEHHHDHEHEEEEHKGHQHHGHGEEHGHTEDAEEHLETEDRKHRLENGENHSNEFEMMQNKNT